MAERPESRTRTVRFFLILAVIGAVVGLIGVYVIGPGNGNRTVGAACAGAPDRNSAIAEFARGEVAALAISERAVAATDIGFLNPDGSPATIADWAGRTVLLNLWATWCTPCRQEMPGLDRLEAELGGEGFEVVAVNIDTRNPDKPNAFLDEIGISSLKRYRDPKADIFKLLRSRGLAFGMPTTLLVDAEGCLIGHMAGAAEWDSPDAKALIGAAMAAGSS